MSVIVNLPAKTEQALRAKAAEVGKSVEDLLADLAHQAAATESPATDPMDQTPAAIKKWVADWRAWVASHQPGPAFVDDSRESIYEGRGE